MKKQENNKYLPLVLVILDGWGIAPDSKCNACSLASTPFLDNLFTKFPNTLLTAHGRKVGLHKGQTGNSEAGHSNIGAGRIVKQDTRIVSDAVKDGTFFKNTALIEAINHAKKNNSNIHIMGLLTGKHSAHAYPEHFYALLDFFKKQNFHRVYIHLFTDGRDSSPHAAGRFINKLINNFENNEIISSVMGRFYAMDRIKAWHRTEKAYNAMVMGEGIVSDNPYKAISEAYDRGETDEFITPTVILNPKKKAKFINHNDSIIFFNLRSDRARQMTKPFVQKNFEKKNGNTFKRKKVLKNLKFVALSDFGPDLDSILTAYPSPDHKNTLPKALEGLSQLYISEREKYAHVTYFFNGGHGKPVNGEDWEVIASSGLGNYEKHPQMSSYKLTNIILRKLRNKEYEFITVNFPNPDMIGHTGNMKAAIKALEVCNKSVNRIYKEIKKQKGTMIVTADHGNIENMFNPKIDEVDTDHTTNPVPFIIANKDFDKDSLNLRKKGILADIAPTVLHLLDIKKPKEMTGKTLIKK